MSESYLRLHWRRGNMFYRPFVQASSSNKASSSKVSSSQASPDKTYDKVVGVDSRIDPVGVQQSDSRVPLGPVEFEIEFDKESGGPRSRTLLCSMVRWSTNGANDGVGVVVVRADPCGVFQSLSSAERLGACSQGCGVYADSSDDDDFNTTTGPATTTFCSPENPRPWYRDWMRRVPVNEVARRGLNKPVGAHVAVGQGGCCDCYVNFCWRFGIDILVI
ncbi:hypothetical protein Hte_007259 [Hypoxylon texense]